MLNINENVSLLSNPMDITEKKPDIEENMTLPSTSSSIKQESFQKNRKRKLSDLEDPMMKQKEAEENLRYDYGTISDDAIKERLFKTMTYDVHRRIKINQWLEADKTLLLFIRQHASLLAKYGSFKMELELHQSYINMTQSVLDWLSGMSEKLFIRNNINAKFFKLQIYINKQLKKSEEQFKNIEEKLAKSVQYQEQMTTSSPEIDIRLITSVIVMFVRQDQQRFNVEFIMKRYLLMLNAKDVRLVHEFFHLQPSLRQLHIAECIWQATIDEQRTKTNVQQDNQQNRSKVIHYKKIIEDQKKLFLVRNEQEEEEEEEEEGNDLLPVNYSKLNIDLLMHIIESRQKILIQRIEFECDFNKTFLIDDDGDDNDTDRAKNDDNNDDNENDSEDEDN